MGCCSSRNQALRGSKIEQIFWYIQSSGLSSFDCKQIQRLQVQFQDQLISQNAYQTFLKSTQVKAPFQLFSSKEKIPKIQLLYTLLLFSKDSTQNKLEFCRKLIKDDARRLMHLLEVKFKTIHYKIPNIIRLIDSHKHDQMSSLINSKRLKFGKYTDFFFNKIKDHPENLYLIFDNQMGCGSTKNQKTAQQLLNRPTNKHCAFFWRRGQLIGQGAYGQVYQCLNIDTGELLATKFVEFSGDKTKIIKEIENLKREILMLKQFNHRNIVRYITTDVAADYSGVDIIMEYVPGKSVRHLLNRFKKLHEKTVQKYTIQLLEGVNYLHLKGVIHRDLKCANLLVSNDGTIKVSDFGASKKLESLGGKLCKSLRGSPYWMAPEVAKQVGHSFSADIWSIGCVVIQMLTGRPPWSLQSQSNSVKQVLQIVSRANNPPSLPQKISENCRLFLESCLQINPKKRPTAKNLLLHPFLLQEISVKEEELSQQECIEEVLQDPYELVYDLSAIPVTSIQPVSLRDATVYNIDQIPMTHLSEATASVRNQIPAQSSYARKLREDWEQKQRTIEMEKQNKRLAWEQELKTNSYLSYS